MEGQLYVGGVFVKLFVKQPNWGLRNPKEFCTALLESCVVHACARQRRRPLPLVLITLVSPWLAGLRTRCRFVQHAKPDAGEEPIALISQAFSLLMGTQPGLVHFVASIGLVSKILGIMHSVDNVNVLTAAITISTAAHGWSGGTPQARALTGKPPVLGEGRWPQFTRWCSTRPSWTTWPQSCASRRS